MNRQLTYAENDSNDYNIVRYYRDGYFTARLDTDSDEFEVFEPMTEEEEQEIYDILREEHDEFIYEFDLA